MGIDSIWSKLLKTVGFFAERLDLAKLRLENHCLDLAKLRLKNHLDLTKLRLKNH